MSAYTADGKRRSSQTHASRGHSCEFCDRVSYGNGGRVAHARGHVRRGEAVELVKYYGPSSSRVFVTPGPEVESWLDRGFVVEVGE